MRQVAREAFRHLDLDLELATGRPRSAPARSAATLARCATCTWPTWPSNGARSVSASTWRWSSVTTARWRSASRRLLRVSRPAPWPCRPSILARVGERRSRPSSASSCARGDVDLRAPRRLRSRAGSAPGRARRPGGRSRPGRAALRASARASLRIERGAAGLGFQAGQRRLLPAPACCAVRGCRSRPAPGPCLTTSPATTFSVTVPPAIAYSVGLLAAITRPSAAMSRTRSPRVTSAMRTRAASNERLPAPSPTAASRRPAAAPRRRRRRSASRLRRAAAGAAVARTGGPGRRCRGSHAGSFAGRGRCRTQAGPVPTAKPLIQGLRIDRRVRVSARTADGVRADSARPSGRRAKLRDSPAGVAAPCAESSARSRIAMWFRS